MLICLIHDRVLFWAGEYSVRVGLIISAEMEAASEFDVDP
jgi:hypothetical protein